MSAFCSNNVTILWLTGWARAQNRYDTLTITYRLRRTHGVNSLEESAAFVRHVSDSFLYERENSWQIVSDLCPFLVFCVSYTIGRTEK